MGSWLNDRSGLRHLSVVSALTVYIWLSFQVACCTLSLLIRLMEVLKIELLYTVFLYFVKLPVDLTMDFVLPLYFEYSIR